MKKLNQNQYIIIGANGLLIFSTLLILGIFSTLYQFYLDTSNPIIPKNLLYELNALKILAGLYITFTILVMIILKLLKQHLLIVIIGIITVISYYAVINNGG